MFLGKSRAVPIKKKGGGGGGDPSFTDEDVAKVKELTSSLSDPACGHKRDSELRFGFISWLCLHVGILLSQHSLCVSGRFVES